MIKILTNEFINAHNEAEQFKKVYFFGLKLYDRSDISNNVNIINTLKSKKIKSNNNIKGFGK